MTRDLFTQIPEKLFFNFIFQIDLKTHIKHFRVSWPIIPLLRSATSDEKVERRSMVVKILALT
jgi:hypothetical protein